MKATPFLLGIIIVLSGFSRFQSQQISSSDTLRYQQEVNLKNVRQLTFGGNNAEAYFSFDGKRLSFQSDNKAWGLECDQIFQMDIPPSL